LPVWVCAEAVDFRLGIDGLALRVQASLGPQRALSSAHVFFNRGRDKVTILSISGPGVVSASARSSAISPGRNQSRSSTARWAT
ncbi:MAG: IS66 family insertion sequence element accessory protein TnpB, partial [Xanthomonadales bacterium]|nr:IS66 family insertion sequence element accessory protein TnpB [Xanthomonadales bacterium]